ncbi:hypothetical protein WICMUC_004148 [Wickerhamomyces mucosus]|uniref:Uncharacterized protein n=1 Tax=Wickerhamomyces mucosus TaxID=1378264 RepID=A0A9P8PJ27_9ASCO|nr:hypothetical protein WICMUC_004148 [Wickerhamomyces mucosus]
MSVFAPSNEDHPIKLVLLGGPNVGKSTFANRMHSKFFRETYYPTHKSTMLLFDYFAQTLKSKAVLDEYGGLEGKSIVTADNDLLLSPTIFQSYTKNVSSESKKRRNSNGSNTKLIKNNYYNYKYANYYGNYHEPLISPISIELIDTPAFRPDMVVPFLEVSLFRNLDKEDLHNLANEPRKPVSTNPLLVASGSGELDGNVNGYVFMYSAVPSSNPPSYDESLNPTKVPAVDTTSSEDTTQEEIIYRETLGILELMRGAIYDAWREYRNYQKRWEKGQEGDVYSLVYGIKQLWKMRSIEEEQRKLQELRKISYELDTLNTDPSSPESPPPIIIVCTHCNHPGAAPFLIDQGKNLANAWKSSFIMIDNQDNKNVEESLALIIREIVEKENLQKLRKKFGK